MMFEKKQPSPKQAFFFLRHLTSLHNLCRKLPIGLKICSVWRKTAKGRPCWAPDHGGSGGFWEEFPEPSLRPQLQNLQIFVPFPWQKIQLELQTLLFFLRLPTGQYGPVSQLSRSEERCTGPFNWGEAHCAGEKVKRKIGPFQWKSL